MNKLKVSVQFPPSVAGTGLRLDKNQGHWKFSIDVSQLPRQPSWAPVPGNTVAILGSSGTIFRVPLPILITTPSPLVIYDNAPIGSLVGLLSVFGGTGIYTYTLTSNPGGLYSISGNQLLTATPQTIGTYPISLKADNGAGSVVKLNTTVTVLHLVIVPHYYIYGF